MFFCSAPHDYARAAGHNADEAKQNYFCGRKRICFASALFSEQLGFGIRRAGGYGRNARRILFEFLAKCLQKAELVLVFSI